MKERGIVVTWKESYGFIHRTIDGQVQRFFFHITECNRPPKVGDTARFNLGPGRNGKAECAINVELFSPGAQQLMQGGVE